MVACRAYLWRLCAFKYIAAHHTLPFDRLLTLPNRAGLDLLKILLKAVAMMSLDLSYSLEMLGDILKPFLAGHLGGFDISVDTFGSFLSYRNLQI